MGFSNVLSKFMTATSSENQVYQGQFGSFTITDNDRLEVIIYRTGLVIAALSFALGNSMLLFLGSTETVLGSLTVLFGFFSLGLGASLITIHIYLKPLHYLLQAFWIVGTLATIGLIIGNNTSLARFVYDNPLSILGIGFTFAALTGIYFKEAFCFNRLETKFLTPLVPLLLLGHLFGFLPISIEQTLLAFWSALFIIFAFRKIFQDIPSDIGDKSVFEYLKQKG